MKPNKFFESKKKENQVLANRKESANDRYEREKKAQAEAEAHVQRETMRLKGKKFGRCNRGACLSASNVIFFNKGTRLYYCDICSVRINEYCEKDDLLCKTDDGVDPRQWRYNEAQEQRKKFMEQIDEKDVAGKDT